MSNATQWVAMGYIKGAFGVRGWVKVSVDTEYIDSLLDYPEWRLNKDGQSRILAVESGKVSGDELQIKFVGIDDRDVAHGLRGYTIEIPRSAFTPTEEDEYYWADLVGMKVVNQEGISLGQVHNLMETGAHDILIIQGETGQILIPFVSQFIIQVNREEGIITADWGLDY